MVALHWIINNPELTSLFATAVTGLVLARYFGSAPNRQSKIETRRYQIIAPDGKRFAVASVSKQEIRLLRWDGKEVTFKTDPDENLDTKIDKAIEAYQDPRTANVGVASAP